jgi:endonuclease YncB( thermonuclease family)
MAQWTGRRPARPRFDLRVVAGAIVLVIALGAYVYKRWIAEPLPPLTGIARVADGDSLEIGGTRIRLEGIDAVELHQTCTDPRGQAWPCGERAMREVRNRVAGRRLRCESKGRDRFDRVLAVCFLDDGSDLNAWIVRQGWAVTYGHGHPYQAEQDEAKAARRGIWAGSFTPPREWRQQHQRTD